MNNFSFDKNVKYKNNVRPLFLSLFLICFLLNVKAQTLFPISSSTGQFHVSINSSITLSNPAPGGTWTSANTSVATIDSNSGVVTGKTKGTSEITYTLGSESMAQIITVGNTVVNYMYTNYNTVTKTNNGFWHSGIGNLNTGDPAPPNDVNTPDNTHELLAFKYNEQVYSTGVSDATLTNNNISFSSGKYKALPVQNVNFNYTTGSVLFGFGDRVDSVIGGHAAVGSFPRQASIGAKLTYVLNSGKQGLNLGSVVTNVPSSVVLNFEGILGISNVSFIGDGVPEILITQMAQPTGTPDKVYFVDKNGNTVGKELSINFNSETPSLGRWHLDLFHPGSGLPWSQGSGWDENGRLRPIRIWARDAADFGITPDNAGDIAALRYKMGGSSDPAFLAYNADFLYVIGAVDDYVSTNTAKTVTIPVLENDVYDNSYPDAAGKTTYIQIVNLPSHGTVNLNDVTQTPAGKYRVTPNTTISYTSNESFPATGDSFTYAICDSANNICKEADVTIYNVTKNYWHGTVDADWTNPGNWTANRVPQQGDDIEFATNANNGASGDGDGNGKGAAVNDLHVPVSDRIIGKLINLSDKKLVVLPDNAITVEGDIDTGGANRILVKAEPDKANGIFIFPQGASAPLATVEMYFKAHGTASDTPDIAPWQYFGIPVTSFSSGQMYYGSYVREYIEALDDAAYNNSIIEYWVFLNNNSVMEPFKGYEITELGKNPNGYNSFAGTLVNCDKTIPLSYTARNTYTAGQHVISNPYTAPLSIANGLLFDANTEKSVYLFHTGSSTDYNTHAGSPVTYGSASVAQGQYSVVPQNSSIPDLPTHISSMQGFVVKTSGTTPGSVTMKYDVGVPASGGKPLMRTADTNKTPAVYTKITLWNEMVLKDQVWLVVNENSTRGFDNGYDGPKMFGASKLAQLYAIEFDGGYQINTIPELSSELMFKPETGINDYTLRFEHFNHEELNEVVYLYDLFNGIQTDITDSGSAYSFTSYLSDVHSRFRIYTVPKTVTSSGALEDTQCIIAYAHGNRVYVNNTLALEANLTLYDILGRELIYKKLQPNEYLDFDTDMPEGIYTLVITAVGYTKTKKIRITKS